MPINRTERILTRLSKTHLFSFHSAGRHCQSCWLLLSKQVQCFLNSARQCLFTSSILSNHILAFCSLDSSTSGDSLLYIPQRPERSCVAVHPARLQLCGICHFHSASCCNHYIENERHLHAFCASCNPSALLQAVYLALSTALGFALHEIVIVSFASCSNKETGR